MNKVEVLFIPTTQLGIELDSVTQGNFLVEFKFKFMKVDYDTVMLMQDIQNPIVHPK